MQMGFPRHKTACPQSRVSLGKRACAFVALSIWVHLSLKNAKPSVKTSGLSQILPTFLNITLGSLLCVQGYSHTHCQLRGFNFIGTLSDLPKNWQSLSPSLQLPNKLFFSKVVGSLSLNSDQLHEFYYISFPFHLPCRKGVHTELLISTSPGSVLWLYNLKGEIWKGLFWGHRLNPVGKSKATNLCSTDIAVLHWVLVRDLTREHCSTFLCFGRNVTATCHTPIWPKYYFKFPPLCLSSLQHLTLLKYHHQLPHMQLMSPLIEHQGMPTRSYCHMTLMHPSKDEWQCCIGDRGKNCLWVLQSIHHSQPDILPSRGESWTNGTPRCIT